MHCLKRCLRQSVICCHNHSFQTVTRYLLISYNGEVRFFTDYFHEILTKIDSYQKSKRVTFLERCIKVNMNNVDQAFTVV